MSVFRGVLLGLAIEVALALLALGACAVVAHAAPAPPAAQANADATAAWLTRTLHRPVPTRRIVVQEASQMAIACGTRKCDAYVPFSDPSTIVTTPRVARQWARLRSGSIRVANFGHTLLHELLHSPTLNAADYGDGWVDEGVTEAVAVDLYPAWWRWLTGQDQAVIPGYPDRVSAIRAASVAATISQTWRDRAARLWRRDLLAADAQTRARMLAAVNQ